MGAFLSGSFCSACISRNPRGIERAPGMKPARTSSFSRTSTSTMGCFCSRRFLTSSSVTVRMDPRTSDRRSPYVFVMPVEEVSSKSDASSSIRPRISGTALAEQADDQRPQRRVAAVADRGRPASSTARCPTTETTSSTSRPSPYTSSRSGRETLGGHAPGSCTRRCRLGHAAARSAREPEVGEDGLSRRERRSRWRA